ncbi:MAG: hypothetical protein PHG64_06295, partial [Paludibacter sp.]|nr:hypothetical protein [Paludibacter sp.]
MQVWWYFTFFSNPIVYQIIISIFAPAFKAKNNIINFKKLVNSMLNHYETVFILTPVLSDAQM